MFRDGTFDDPSTQGLAVMGGSGSGRQMTGKKRAAPAPLAPQGGDGKRRTPQHSFDSAAGADTYEPESIQAQRIGQGGDGRAQTHFLVKWVGYPTSANTWEPDVHLVECPELIAEFRERKKEADRVYEAELAAARKQREDDAAGARANAASLQAATRVALLPQAHFFCL